MSQSIDTHESEGLAHVHVQLNMLLGRLGDLTVWDPAAALIARGEDLRDDLSAMEGRWRSKLVVALVGQSGAGKSTLINRLAGREVSTTGLTRPTTRHVIACASDERDVAWLREALGEERVAAIASESAPADLVLLDTPDTNTLPENRALLTELLGHVDILVPVFSALNPKLADNVAYLAPFVERVPADAVLPVMTMVDRIPRDDLFGDVVPDWHRFVEETWRLDEVAVFLVDARGDDRPSVDDEAPLHAVDQYDDLLDALRHGAGDEGRAASRRTAQAEKMLQLYEREIAHELNRTGAARAQARGLLDALTESTAREVRRDLLARGRRVPSELNAAAISAVSQRLWGPVGWVMLLWALGVRLTQALGQVRRGGLGNAWRGQGESPAYGRWPERMAASLAGALHRSTAAGWPPVGDALARSGLGAYRVQPAADDATTALVEICYRQAEQALERLARRMSHWLVQLVFNAPLLGLGGWIAWDALSGLFRQEFLPAGYFDQALIALIVIWIMAFALYQVVLALAMRWAVNRRMVKRLASLAVDRLIVEQRDAMVRIADLGSVLTSG